MRDDEPPVAAERPERPPVGCATVASVVAFIVWGVLAWSGFDLYRRTAARVPDSPYLAGQWNGYVVVPLSGAVVAFGLCVVVRRWHRLALAVLLLSLVMMIAVLSYLSDYTGGI